MNRFGGRMYDHVWMFQNQRPRGCSDYFKGKAVGGVDCREWPRTYFTKSIYDPATNFTTKLSGAYVAISVASLVTILYTIV